MQIAVIISPLALAELSVSLPQSPKLPKILGSELLSVESNSRLEGSQLTCGRIEFCKAKMSANGILTLSGEGEGMEMSGEGTGEGPGALGQGPGAARAAPAEAAADIYRH